MRLPDGFGKAEPQCWNVDPEKHRKEAEQLQKGNPHQDGWPVEQYPPDQECYGVFPFHYLSPNVKISG
ncbi:MAG: hypothetical protein CSA31_00610 [Desulfobulbus propionicus]|nr:MAG: hypothetical protein CSA31_00610 [Desulfobulbus propionicus]